MEVDGDVVDVSQGHVYKGLMLSDVPNAALAVGYTNASWTLRADLSARWFCSLVRFMERKGYAVATPRYDEEGVASTPLLDLSSGYVRRAAHLLPQQGQRRAVARRAELRARPPRDAAGADRRRSARAAVTSGPGD